MADLTTKYMGLELRSPVVAGASTLTSNMNTIKKIEDNGAGALVISSLFEEQVQLESVEMKNELEENDEKYAEMTSIFPKLEHAGPDEHLMWVKKAKEAVSIPVIASLNAKNEGVWIKWAKKLEDSGVDGLELNFYAAPMDLAATGDAIEDKQIAAVEKVKKAVNIPVSVKLSPYYANPLNVVLRMDEIGADGFVLFNRFIHPAIDVDKQEIAVKINESTPDDHRLAARYIGLLLGNVGASLIGSNGVHTADQAVSLLLAGADAVQTVTSLFIHGIGHIQTINANIAKWMEGKGYEKISDFAGKLSEKNTNDPWAYRRAQYVKTLLRPKEYINYV
ncbi:MAG: dihydroorotate dehydrogenase-like protein [Spirochaetia bacterium]